MAEEFDVRFGPNETQEIVTYTDLDEITDELKTMLALHGYSVEKNRTVGNKNCVESFSPLVPAYDYYVRSNNDPTIVFKRKSISSDARCYLQSEQTEQWAWARCYVRYKTDMDIPTREPLYDFGFD